MNPFLQDSGATVPIIGGAMYPCSNPELVAAVSEAGGIGIIQPVSLVYVHGHEFRAGLKKIKTLTKKPVGINILVEKSSKIYEQRMQAWVDIALEEGIRFFVTALGNPTWVLEKARQVNGKVYHDITTPHWAKKALDYGVDGLICVNHSAGGHAGTESAQKLYDELKPYGKPLICAGGIGSPEAYRRALAIGYHGVQMGTRFIASQECKVHSDYKQAILKATPADIVLTEKITGVPVSVIKTPMVERVGTKAGPIARWLLRGKKTKHWMRIFYTLKSFYQLKKASLEGTQYKDYYQAGKSVEGVDEILSVRDIIHSFERSSP